MTNLSNIKIISLDLYRTLVDLEYTPELIWQTFLKDRFPDELSREYLRRCDRILARRWDAAGTDSRHFKSCRTIVEDTISELFQEMDFTCDINPLAGKIIDRHMAKKLYDDVAPFLNKVKSNYTICLSTDCDTDMLGGISNIFPFDECFVSEKLCAYKLNPDFFKYVISHYHIPPENILHVGDSKSDILVPEQLGIRTCWLNRLNRKWGHSIKPDLEVSSLLEIPDLLG